MVIRLTALGDVVLMEPVLRALRQLRPGLPIDLVTEAHYAALAARALPVDTVTGWDRRGQDAGFKGVERVRSRLPSSRYELIVDLQGKLRTRTLAHRLDAGRRLFLQKRSPLGAILSVFGHDPPQKQRHSTQLYLDVLRPLGALEGFDPRPRLGLPRVPHPGLRIGLAPGASHATKEWPLDHFRALAQGLLTARPQAELSLIGGPSERAKLEVLRASGVTFTDGDSTTLDVLALTERLAGLDLLISVDTGPAHLAAALGVPTVVIFGPTSPVRWGPLGAPHRAVSLHLDCAPCSNTGGARCPRPDRDLLCLRSLSVERVLSDSLQVLEAIGR